MPPHAGDGGYGAPAHGVYGYGGPRRGGMNGRGRGRGGGMGGRMRFDDTGRLVTFENLPASFAWQELKDLCKPYGRVIRADVNRDAGAGSAVFETAADAQAAVDALQGSDVGGATIAVSLDGGGGYGAMGGAMGMGGAPMHHGGHHVGAYHPGAMAHAPLGAPGHQYAHGMYGAPHHPGALYPLGPDGLAHLPPGAGLPPHAVLHGVVPPGVPAAPFGGVGAPGAPGALHHPGLYHAYAHHPHAHHHHHHHHMGHIQMPPGAMHPAQPPHLGATMHGAHAPPPPAAGAPPGSPPGPPPAGAGEPDAPPDIPAIHDGEAYDGVVPLDSYGESARGAAAGARARARALLERARLTAALGLSPRALPLCHAGGEYLPGPPPRGEGKHWDATQT